MIIYLFIIIYTDIPPQGHMFSFGRVTSLWIAHAGFKSGGRGIDWGVGEGHGDLE
jgi:hypothetical protein